VVDALVRAAAAAPLACASALRALARKDAGALMQAADRLAEAAAEAGPAGEALAALRRCLAAPAE
jgi:hypothetical protein